MCVCWPGGWGGHRGSIVSDWKAEVLGGGSGKVEGKLYLEHLRSSIPNILMCIWMLTYTVCYIQFQGLRHCAAAIWWLTSSSDKFAFYLPVNKVTLLVASSVTLKLLYKYLAILQINLNLCGNVDSCCPDNNHSWQDDIKRAGLNLYVHVLDHFLHTVQPWPTGVDTPGLTQTHTQRWPTLPVRQRHPLGQRAWTVSTTSHVESSHPRLSTSLFSLSLSVAEWMAGALLDKQNKFWTPRIAKRVLLLLFWMPDVMLLSL